MLSGSISAGPHPGGVPTVPHGTLLSPPGMGGAMAKSDPLFVGNLGMYVDEDELRETFSRFGNVTMAQVRAFRVCVRACLGERRKAPWAVRRKAHIGLLCRSRRERVKRMLSTVTFGWPRYSRATSRSSAWQHGVSPCSNAAVLVSTATDCSV